MIFILHLVLTLASLSASSSWNVAATKRLRRHVFSDSHCNKSELDVSLIRQLLSDGAEPGSLIESYTKFSCVILAEYAKAGSRLSVWDFDMMVYYKASDLLECLSGIASEGQQILQDTSFLLTTNTYRSDSDLIERLWTLRSLGYSPTLKDLGKPMKDLEFVQLYALLESMKPAAYPFLLDQFMEALKAYKGNRIPDWKSANMEGLVDFLVNKFEGKITSKVIDTGLDVISNFHKRYDNALNLVGHLISLCNEEDAVTSEMLHKAFYANARVFKTLLKRAGPGPFCFANLSDAYPSSLLEHTLREVNRCDHETVKMMLQKGASAQINGRLEYYMTGSVALSPGNVDHLKLVLLLKDAGARKSWLDKIFPHESCSKCLPHALKWREQQRSWAGVRHYAPVLTDAEGNFSPLPNELNMAIRDTLYQLHQLD